MPRRLMDCMIDERPTEMVWRRRSSHQSGVTNGLFTTGNGFCAGNFDGTNLWLEISVRTNGRFFFTRLSPRQIVIVRAVYIRALSAVNATTAALATNVSGSVLLCSFPPMWRGWILFKRLRAQALKLDGIDSLRDWRRADFQRASGCL